MRLQQVIHHQDDLAAMDDLTRIRHIKENILACTDELHEALNEIGWKQWATSRHINEDALKKELIDAAHFLINLMLHAGMTADEFFEMYIVKNKRNFERQAEGYDGVSSKCPHCARALDDVGVVQLRILGELAFACGHCEKGLDPRTIIGKESMERIMRITKILNTAT